MIEKGRKGELTVRQHKTTFLENEVVRLNGLESDFEVGLSAGAAMAQRPPPGFEGGGVGAGGGGVSAESEPAEFRN